MTSAPVHKYGGFLKCQCEWRKSTHKKKRYSTDRIINASYSKTSLKHVRVLYGLVYRFQSVLRGPRVVREFHSGVLYTGRSITEHSFRFWSHLFLLFLLRCSKFQFHTTTNVCQLLKINIHSPVLKFLRIRNRKKLNVPPSSAEIFR
jgi:hypothetical protein